MFLFFCRLHRRRSVSICGRALTYFSTRQIPDEVDDGDFYGGSDTDELGKPSIPNKSVADRYVEL